MNAHLLPLVRTAMGLLDAAAIGATPRRRRSARVLIVRVDSIGDMVLWVDGARALREHYNALGHEVVLLGNNVWAPWAAELDLADLVWGLDTGRFVRDFRYRWGWLRRLRRENFSAVLQPVYSRAFLLGDSLVRATGAPERTGFSPDADAMSPFLRRWSNRWYTRLIPTSPGRVMELERNAEFVRGMGVTSFAARVPTLPPGPSSRRGRVPNSRYAVLFPGAAWVGRAWPVAGFTEIGRRLLARGLAVVVAGGPADRPQGERLTQALGTDVLNLVGETSLPELAQLLRGARVVVANETSAVHIGAAVAVPVVCVLGGGHYGRFAPYTVAAEDTTRPLPTFVSRQMPCFGCNWVCQFPRATDESVKCVREVPVDEVWAGIETALSSSAEAR